MHTQLQIIKLYNFDTLTNDLNINIVPGKNIVFDNLDTNIVSEIKGLSSTDVGVFDISKINNKLTLINNFVTENIYDDLIVNDIQFDISFANNIQSFTPTFNIYDFRANFRSIHIINYQTHILDISSATGITKNTNLKWNASDINIDISFNGYFLNSTSIDVAGIINVDLDRPTSTNYDISMGFTYPTGDKGYIYKR